MKYKQGDVVLVKSIPGISDEVLPAYVKILDVDEKCKEYTAHFRTGDYLISDEDIDRVGTEQPSIQVGVSPKETRITDPNTGGQKGSKPQQPAQIPPEFLLALGEHYAKGIAKYPDVEPGLPNWSRGYAWSLSVNSLLRHILEWINGEEFDEDGNPNLIAVAWHAATLHTFQTKGLGTDDRPVY